MKFSCVLPVYNTEKETLHQCVSSVLNQTFRDYEIILVDDGSNQNTAFICDCYADQYSNIKVIHQENMGLAGARNTGIDHVSGDWIVHIDADDWIDADLLQKLSCAIENNICDIVFWGYRACIGNKKVEYLLKNESIMEDKYEIRKHEMIKAIMFASKKFNDVALNTTWGKAFRTKYVKQNNLKFNPDLKRSQDVIYNLYAFDRAAEVLYLPTASYNYRLDNDSLSRGYNTKMFERMTKTANACLEFADKHSDTPEYKIAAFVFCRRCFRNIILQDYMNKSNPQKRGIKKKRFKEGLIQEPYKTAFSMVNIRDNEERDHIESHMIAKGQYDILSLYWTVRKIARMIRR